MAISFDRAADVLLRGHADRVFPAAVAEVGDRGSAVWRFAAGRLDDDNGAPAALDTIFDLASLTKVLSTASLAMQAIEAGRLDLQDPVARWIPEWRGKDRDYVTVRALLTHSSGLTAWLPFYRDYSGRRDFQHAICALPLEYEPDTHSLYSDLGFILLGFILEDVGRAPLQAQALRMFAGITEGPLLFNPPPALRARIAPTGLDPWRGRMLVGEVHDENCWALGGVAGHAGLFGTASAVGAFARAILRTEAGEGTPLAARDLVQRFTRRYEGLPGSRALAWDTMLPTSSCGPAMSPRAFGHTGFTGTSVWIDPEAGVYIVLLTNRVFPDRDSTGIQEVRVALHTAVMHALRGQRP